MLKFCDSVLNGMLQEELQPHRAYHMKLPPVVVTVAKAKEHIRAEVMRRGTLLPTVYLFTPSSANCLRSTDLWPTLRATYS